MKITRQADYAVRVVLYHAGRPENSIVTVDEVSRIKKIPRSFAAKIYQRLCRAGITSSLRGATGGFVLARRPDDISLLEVVEAIDGEVDINLCVVDEKACSLSNSCAVHPVWMELRRDMVRKMKAVDFGSLAKVEKEVKEKR